jgi:hypothetical protein
MQSKTAIHQFSAICYHKVDVPFERHLIRGLKSSFPNFSVHSRKSPNVNKFAFLSTRHEDVLGEWSGAPHIFKFSSSEKNCFTLRRPSPCTTTLSTDMSVLENKLTTLPGTGLRFVGRSARVPDITLITLSGDETWQLHPEVITQCKQTHSKLPWVVRLLTCIRAVPGSKLSRHAGNPNNLVVFLQLPSQIPWLYHNEASSASFYIIFNSLFTSALGAI